MLTFKFDTVKSVLDKDRKEDDTNEFVSAVCWRALPDGVSFCISFPTLVSHMMHCVYIYIYTQVSLLSLKYKLLYIFSFLLSITSPKEIDILESSNWIVTKGTVIEMFHHADIMSLLCTHSIICIPLLHHYQVISVSLLQDWKFIQETNCVSLPFLISCSIG